MNKNKNKNKKLLIVAPYQFGELSDCYYWAKYSTIEGWNVTYIGYKSKGGRLKARSFPGVRVIEVPHLRNRFIHGLSFYSAIIFSILLGRFRNVIICSFPGVKILGKLFKQRNIVIDIRTLSVSKDSNRRKQMDDSLRSVLPFFSKVTAISEGVQKQLNHPSYLLPLGAEPLSATPKKFDNMRLFYIGGFDNRDIDVFLKGLSLFQKKHNLSVTFDIVGGGSEKTECELHSLVSSFGISGVTFHGYLNHDEAKSLFDSCNIGICYVPITDYYQYQPPTKLFEYLLSGMACIATKTIANKKVVTNENGILVDDNAESVCEGLYKLSSNLVSYNSATIVKHSMQYHWEKIVREDFLPLFQL